MGRGGLTAVAAIAVVLALAIFGFVKGFDALGISSVGGLTSIQQDLQAARLDLQKTHLEVQQKTTQINQLQEQIKQLQGQGGGSVPPPAPAPAGSAKLPSPTAMATLGDLAKRAGDITDGWRHVAGKVLAKADFAALARATKVRYDDKDPSFGAARDYALNDSKRQGVVDLLGGCVPIGTEAIPTRPDLVLTYTVDNKAQVVTVAGNFAYFNGKGYFGLDLLQQIRAQVAGW